MGERFYLQQLARLGTCVGYKSTKRKKKMAWTDERKAQAVEMYEKAEPTPETSMEIVKEIAEELGESPNGVRMVLTKAGVYIKKAAGSASAGAAKASGGTRVSKEAAIGGLTAALTDAGQEVDADIVSKLTGKAAVYFTNVVNALNK